ncbi:MAG: hypothetical protein FJ217_08205 [Ignavibacteria bacterium]|nr:hypothetical protein [Ignavibacteria bacterium]
MVSPCWRVDDFLTECEKGAGGHTRRPKKSKEILMGMVMKDLRGRIDGAQVAERIAQEVH